MKPSGYSHVAVLRLAHPDSPSLREIARAVGLTATYISEFERGIVDMSHERLELYAGALEVDPELVRVRWLQQALSFHQAQVEQLREAIKATGSRPAKGRHSKPGRKNARLSLDKRRYPA